MMFSGCILRRGEEERGEGVYRERERWKAKRRGRQGRKEEREKGEKEVVI